MSETHVGVIGNLPVPTPVQRTKLAHALASIALGKSGRLVLHHGCGEGADEVAHQMVRLLGGWQIHGHPAQTDGGDSPHRRRTKSDMDDLDVRHQMKPPVERDADIVEASAILIIAGPYDGDPIHAAKPGIGAANRAAGKAVREIFYLHPPAVQRKPSRQTDGAKRATARAAAAAGVKDVSSPARQGREDRKAVTPTARAAATASVKDVNWAARQGREDRKTGTRCGSCKAFRKRYNLWESEKTDEMWSRYFRSSQPVPTNTQREGPSPRKRTGPSRSSALSEERLKRLQALQRKLNPPEAIRDAWR